LRDVFGKRCVGSNLQLAAQGGLVVGGDGERTTGRRPWGQIASQALLAKPAGNTALRDLKRLDQLATRQTASVGSQDAFAQIG